MVLKFTQLFKSSPSFTLLAINLTLAILWGISLALRHVGLPYFTPLFGTLALFAPGLCLALLLEQLSEAKSKPLIFLLWIVLFSFVLTPAAVFGLSLLFRGQPPVHVIVPPFLIWWALCFAMAAVVIFIKRQPTTFSSLPLDTVTKKEIAYIVGGYVAIMLINFIVYPLLPEGDGYALLVKWDAIWANPTLLAAETRGLFLIFVNLCAQVLKIDPYWVLKAFLPLSHITIVLACYIFARNFLTDSRYRVLLSLSPLAFPVVLQEILISRPQSVFLISFLPSIVIISEIITDKDHIRQVYWLFALFIIGSLGIKIHTLLAFIAFISLISIVIFLRREIARRPLDSVIIMVVLFVLIYPQLASTRILSDSQHLLELFVAYARRSHFEFWFIDHYRNVDGIEAGWPGLSSLFYYGYNLGLVLPVVFIWLVARKKVATFKQLFREKYWAIIFLFIFFFFIAEIAPRFQIAYLPDRAWLILALLFSLLLPLMIMGLKKNDSPRLIGFIVAISLISLAAGTGLTYAKQGWVTPDEVKAAHFIKTQTPENAIFLAQGGTRMMVRYYTKRDSIRPKQDAIFLTGEKSALEAYFKSEEAGYQEGLAAVPKQEADVRSKLNEVCDEKGSLDLTDGKLMAFLESLSIFRQRKDNYLANVAHLKEIYPTIDRPIYLIYNQNKFSSLYGSRGWWRSSNFYGAKLDRLNENYPVVYNQNGVMIWEARK